MKKKTFKEALAELHICASISPFIFSCGIPAIKQIVEINMRKQEEEVKQAKQKSK